VCCCRQTASGVGGLYRRYLNGNLGIAFLLDPLFVRKTPSIGMISDPDMGIGPMFRAG
jgi:hypothetical protein